MTSAPLPSEQPIRRVLIHRLGSLGDTVVALPCLHLIARSFPQAERVLLTNFPVHAKAPAAAAILGDTGAGGAGLIDGYMRYTVGTRHPIELLGLIWKIRRFKPDLLIYLMPMRPPKNVRRDRRFFRLAGVRRIVGLPGDEELKHRFDEGSGLYESEASRLARTVASLGDAHVQEPANWSLRLTQTERETATAALGALAGRPMIVCGPGTKMQAKDWGQENWRALLTHLHQRYPGYGLALVGAREDAEVSESAAQGWAGNKVNLCGRLTPRETAAVMEHAAVFLGPDSGPMHLAACAGVPCVIAFSARELPGIWYPAGGQHRIVYHQTSCFGCQLETCTVEARRCLASIAVAEMAEAVGRVLARRAL